MVKYFQLFRQFREIDLAYFLCSFLWTEHMQFLKTGAATRRVLQKGVLKYFTKFTGKYMYQSLFFYTVSGLRPATLWKKRLWHRCFPVNFVKFLRNVFYRIPLDDRFYKDKRHSKCTWSIYRANLNSVIWRINNSFSIT